MDSSVKVFSISSLLDGLRQHEHVETGYSANCINPCVAGTPLQSAESDRDSSKKPRTSFTKNQIALLEERFAVQKYLTSGERCVLAEELQMSDAQVKTWFQNRRTKWRRQEAETRDAQQRNAARLFGYPLDYYEQQ